MVTNAIIFPDRIPTSFQARAPITKYAKEKAVKVTKIIKTHPIKKASPSNPSANAAYVMEGIKVPMMIHK